MIFAILEQITMILNKIILNGHTHSWPARHARLTQLTFKPTKAPLAVIFTDSNSVLNM